MSEESNPKTPAPSKPRYAPTLYPPPTSSSKAIYFDTFPNEAANDSSSSASSADSTPKTYHNGSLDTSANALPLGSGQNTAGSHATPPPTIKEGLKTIRLEDFTQVHKYPGVRDSLLMGIGAGFGAGGLRFVLAGRRGGVLGESFA